MSKAMSLNQSWIQHAQELFRNLFFVSLLIILLGLCGVFDNYGLFSLLSFSALTLNFGILWLVFTLVLHTNAKNFPKIKSKVSDSKKNKELQKPTQYQFDSRCLGSIPFILSIAFLIYHSLFPISYVSFHLTQVFVLEMLLVFIAFLPYLSDIRNQNKSQDSVPVQEKSAEVPSETTQSSDTTKTPFQQWLSSFTARIRKEGFLATLAPIMLILLFGFFAIYHLGNFMTVDEPKWLHTRVPALYSAFEHGDFASTYINDKPGYVPALLSGIFTNLDQHNSVSTQDLPSYLFTWRLPLVLFMMGLLGVSYYYARKLLSRWFSILFLGLLVSTPLLIGITQIVNPDATLWLPSLISFLAFLTYLQSSKRVHLLVSASFLTLALLSKYVAGVFYVILPLLVIIDYVFSTQKSFTALLSKLFDTYLLFLLSFSMYFVLFPATWSSISLLFHGTIGSPLLADSTFFAFIFLLFVLIDVFLLKAKVLEKSARFFTPRLVLGILCSVFLAFLIISIFSLGSSSFDFVSLLDVYDKADRLLYNWFDVARASWLTLLFTVTIPVLFAFITFNFRSIFSPLAVSEHAMIKISSMIFILSFLVGSALGGFVAYARYQVMLYPLYALLAAFCVYELFASWRKVAIGIFLTLTFACVIAAMPFYYSYTNALNPDYRITDSWGMGSYEVAQVVNSFPQAKKLEVWSDREGFSEFFVGQGYWRGQVSPYDVKGLDYVVLTPAGKKIFLRSLDDYNRTGQGTYGKIAAKTNYLSLYDKKPLYALYIDGNPDNYVKLVSFSDK